MRTFPLVVNALLVATIAVFGGQSQEQKLQQAINLIETKGDLAAALPLLEDASKSTDRATAARALLYLAQTQERLGRADAQATYQRIVSDYSAQRDVAEQARVRLALLLANGTSTGVPRWVCNDCGDDSGAAISRDGRVMVFADGDTGDIVMRDLVTSKTSRLRAKAADDFQTSGEEADSPVLSPDGTLVAYRWYPTKQGETFQLRVMATQPNAKPRVLIAAPPDSVRPMAWSSDGKSILAELSKDETELTWVSVADGSQTPIGKLGKRELGQAVALSPDGKFIAYSATAANSNDQFIFVRPAMGGPETTLVSTAAKSRDPLWSPDGSWLLYVSNVSSTYDLWALPMRAGAATGDPKLIRKDLGVPDPIAVTSRNSYYFYQVHVGVRQTELFTIGNGRATPIREVIGSDVAWAPDGKSILVKRRRPGSDTESDVVLHNLATGTERVFRHDGLLGFPSMWLGDGRSFLEIVREGQNLTFFYKVDVESGEFKKLVANRGNPQIATHWNIKTVSPDGKTIYHGTYTAPTGGDTLNRIVALDTATGQYKTIFMLPGSPDELPTAAQEFSIAVSPDGRTLALTTYNPKTKSSKLATVGVDGTGYREVYGPFESSTLRNKLSWSGDGRSIFFATENEKTHRFRVMRIPASGGTPQFTGVDALGLDAFDVSPDGTHIAFHSLEMKYFRADVLSLDLGALLKPSR